MDKRYILALTIMTDTGNIGEIELCQMSSVHICNSIYPINANLICSRVLGCSKDKLPFQAMSDMNYSIKKIKWIQNQSELTTIYETYYNHKMSQNV